MRWSDEGDHMSAIDTDTHIELFAVKKRQQRIWASGDYPRGSAPPRSQSSSTGVTRPAVSRWLTIG
jgi:hypothetical protein